MVARGDLEGAAFRRQNAPGNDLHIPEDIINPQIPQTSFHLIVGEINHGMLGWDYQPGNYSSPWAYSEGDSDYQKEPGETESQLDYCDDDSYNYCLAKQYIVCYTLVPWVVRENGRFVGNLILRQTVKQDVGIVQMLEQRIELTLLSSHNPGNGWYKVKVQDRSRAGLGPEAAIGEGEVPLWNLQDWDGHLAHLALSPLKIPDDFLSNADYVKNVIKIGRFNQEDMTLEIKLALGSGDFPLEVKNPASPTITTNLNFYKITFSSWDEFLKRIRKNSKLVDYFTEDDLVLMQLGMMTNKAIKESEHEWLMELIKELINEKSLEFLVEIEDKAIGKPKKNECFTKTIITFVKDQMENMADQFERLLEFSRNFGKSDDMDDEGQAEPPEPDRRKNNNRVKKIKKAEPKADQKPKARLKYSDKFVRALAQEPELKEMIINVIRTVNMDKMLEMNVNDFDWNAAHWVNHKSKLNDDKSKKNVWTIWAIVSAFDYVLRLLDGVHQNNTIEMTPVRLPLDDFLAPLFANEEMMKLPKLAKLKMEWERRL